MSDTLDPFIQSINDSTKVVAPRAVLINLGINVGLSFLTIFTFNILRPRNRIIYEPKAKYYVGDKAPPQIKPGFFSWVSPLIHAKEPELLEKIGPDAVVFLRFLRLMRWLFTVLAVLACAITLPVNIVYNLRHPSKTRTILSMLTIQDVRGDLLFVHVGATYLFTFVVMFFTWYHWRAVVKLRHQWFRSDEYNKSFYARTLMIQHVPKKLQSDAGLQSLFDGLRVPYPTTAVHIGRRVGELPALIEYHNQAVCDLEKYLVMYLKDGRVGKKRPTIRQGAFLGMGGTKYDAIDFYTERIKTADGAIQRARDSIDTHKAENYGFASMGAVPYAHIVARTLESKSQKGAIITLAPNPKDLIWSNVVKSDAAIASGRTIGFLILCLVCAFYTLPLSLISFLSNLSAVQAWIPFLQTWAADSPQTFSLVSGVLPPAISALFGWVLPKIMRALSKYQGALTRSRLDRAVVARYFGFLVISQLIIFTLLGVLYQSISLIVLEIGHHASFKEILKNFTKLPGQIQTTYIQQSSYWLTFFPLRGFLAVFDLAQLLNLIWLSFKTHMFGRTPRDIKEWTQPPDFEYAVYYSNLLFMGTVALVYTPLAPLVPLMGAVVFWISSIVYKYQLMFVYVSKVESGGRLWNIVVNRIFASTIFMQLLMILTIGLVHGWRSFLWVAGVPPILIVSVFKFWMTKSFMNDFRYYVPDEREIAASKVHSERADSKAGRLEKRFGHPALHADLYTPMVHAKMMHLLPQVYKGRLASDNAKLGEYGGQQAQASVTAGGLKIAGIEQTDLEYDPALYKRDRGEADWDTRSINTTAAMSDFSPSGPANQADYFRSHSRGPSSLADYDAYVQRGPLRRAETSQIELSRLDYNRTTDNLPLLTSTGAGGHGQQRSESHSLRRFDTGGTVDGQDWERPLQVSPPPLHIPGDEYRTAPTHRPQPPQLMMNTNSSESQLLRGGSPPEAFNEYRTASPAQQYPPRQGGADSGNMAGRGARRAAY